MQLKMHEIVMKIPILEGTNAIVTNNIYIYGIRLDDEIFYNSGNP
jgi:hypothetical protein